MKQGANSASSQQQDLRQFKTGFLSAGSVNNKTSLLINTAGVLTLRIHLTEIRLSQSNRDTVVFFTSDGSQADNSSHLRQPRGEEEGNQDVRDPLTLQQNTMSRKLRTLPF